MAVDEVARALELLEVRGSSMFTWFGRTERTVPGTLEESLPAPLLRQQLVRGIQLRLYSNLYCYGVATPVGLAAPSGTSRYHLVTFVRELAAANCGKGGLERGWTLLRSNRHESVIRRGSVVVRARPESVLLAGSGHAAIGEGEVALRTPKDFDKLSPGYFVVVGDTPHEGDPSEPLVRVYWSVVAGSAADYTREATVRLNQAGVPFHLKLLADPTRYHERRDAVVLYLRRSRYKELTGVLEALYAAVAPGMVAGVPLFTKQIASGLACAEDPGGASFGLHRCALLAEAIVRAAELGVVEEANKLALVRTCFEEEGLDYEAPYLNGDSTDIFAFDGSSVSVSPESADAFSRPGTLTPVGPGPVETALGIGSAIVGAAHWHEDRCNWTAIDSYEGPSLQGRDSAFQALGPNLYSGTGGIGIFLADLYAASGDNDMRRAASGAIRHAVSVSTGLLDRAPRGLYTGALGVALSAAYVGLRLREPELQVAAAELAGRVANRHVNDQEPDLTSGAAGAIAGLICLAYLLGDDACLAAAVMDGDRLLNDATREGDQWSWYSPAEKNQVPLTGLAHGASGIGLAFTELYDVTGEERFKAAADAAFKYESRWFVESVGNWPDFRYFESPPPSATRDLRFATAWCHGAPGIALSRLYAFEVTREETYRLEAEAALQTTGAWTRSWLDAPEANFSLCHGLAGNGFILLHGSRILGTDFQPGQALAQAVAEAGVRLRGSGEPFPLDRTFQGAPGLMIGEAGVGQFYLAFTDGAPPIPLLWTPRHLAYLDDVGGDPAGMRAAQ